jgi:hypothetical protein
MNIEMRDQIKSFVLTYKEEVQLARLKIINKVINNFNVKKSNLLKYDLEHQKNNDKLKPLHLEFEELKSEHLREAYLESLPIYD